MMFNVVSYEKVSPTVNRIIKKLIKKMVLPLLTILLITTGFPVWANSSCSVTGGTVSLDNVNLQAGEVTSGKILYKNTHQVTYTCSVTAQLPTFNWYPALSAQGSHLGDVITLLKSLGLAMEITIQEPGTSGSADIKWDTLQDNHFTKIFGTVMGTDSGNYSKCTGEPDTPQQFYCTYRRTANITVKLFVENTFKSINISKSVPSINDVLFIVPVAWGVTSGIPGTSGKGINTSSFNIRILSADLFNLKITPERVNLGRLYKTDTNLFRSGAFDVKVIQQRNTAPNQSFILPLDITFQRGQLSLTSDGKGLVLKNTDDESGNSDGNGLQLAIRDKTSNELVIFDKKRPLGELNIAWHQDGANSVTRQYAVEVSRINGAEIKTGQFTASVPVVVTYN
ncbi:hypothetical protein H1Y64_000960 [Salmonella enterica]|nr:hypothetical protein [Salmonella enterica]EFT9441170.1 hypothetical protein [Salmonella enterica]EFV1301463.1 hypothetical protein [Salmonella enterica]